MHFENRNQILRERLLELKLEGILITCPENILYMSGVDNINGIFSINKDSSCLFTDFRYFDELQEMKPFFEIIEAKDLVKDLAQWLLKKGFKRIGFESAHVSVESFNRFKEALFDIDFVPCKDFVEGLRLIKDQEEQNLIRESAKILGNVMDKVPEIIGQRESITEKELATELDYMMKKTGAQKRAFETIVTTGERSAFPHAAPKECPVNVKNPILVDCGAVYKGYHSDMTRVIVLGEESDKKIEEIYTIVREAQRAALQRVSPGILIKEIDFAAREVIGKAGFEKKFGHGTGHGIGLNVHEEPKINCRSEAVIKPGMVFTVEPGIYLKDEFGIRWEDMVLVTDDGYQLLTSIKWDSLMPV